MAGWVKLGLVGVYLANLNLLWPCKHKLIFFVLQMKKFNYELGMFFLELPSIHLSQKCSQMMLSS